MKNWSNGVLEQWSSGKMEYRNIGMMDDWKDRRPKPKNKPIFGLCGLPNTPSLQYSNTPESLGVSNEHHR
jgi:hypothetical protein